MRGRFSGGGGLEEEGAWGKVVVRLDKEAGELW